MKNREIKRCKKCHEQIIDDGYGDWVHVIRGDNWTEFFYICTGKRREVAAP